MLQLIFSLILIASSSHLLIAEEAKKTVWFLGGHMQHLFDRDYLPIMLHAGYDLNPMHELKAKAEKENFQFLMGDPNTPFLSPFSHEKSGTAGILDSIPSISNKDLKKAQHEFSYIIVFEIYPHQLAYLQQYPKEKLILFLWEPPSVMPQNYDKNNHEIFSKVYTWNDQLVDNKKYFKFFYPVLQPMIEQPISFNNKKLATMIAGNRHSDYPDELYSSRRNLIAFFENTHPNDFDLYGKWWEPIYKTYKGPIENKINCLKNYKFCICYENVKNIPGYITEKIFNCFQAGCVPIYWGASNISDYIPKNCYINRNEFTCDENLYSYINGITKEQHEKYLKNIQMYLKSPQAQLFSSDHFVNTIMNLLML